MEVFFVSPMIKYVKLFYMEDSFMQKLKDTLIGILMVGLFIGIIALLMAYNDGLLDGTIISKIISILLPSFIGTYLITTIVCYWQERLTNNVRHQGLISLVSFILIGASVLFFNMNTLQMIATLVLGLTFITLIAFLIERLFHK